MKKLFIILILSLNFTADVQKNTTFPKYVDNALSVYGLSSSLIEWELCQVKWFTKTKDKNRLPP